MGSPIARLPAQISARTWINYRNHGSLFYYEWRLRNEGKDDEGNNDSARALVFSTNASEPTEAILALVVLLANSASLFDHFLSLSLSLFYFLCQISPLSADICELSLTSSIYVVIERNVKKFLPRVEGWFINIAKGHSSSSSMYSWCTLLPIFSLLTWIINTLLYNMLLIGNIRSLYSIFETLKTYKSYYVTVEICRYLEKYKNL